MLLLLLGVGVPVRRDRKKRFRREMYAAGSCKIQPTSTQNTMAAQRMMAVRVWLEMGGLRLSLLAALVTAARRRTSGEMDLRTRTEIVSSAARALLTETVRVCGQESPCSFEWYEKTSDRAVT